MDCDLGSLYKNCLLIVCSTTSKVRTVNSDSHSIHYLNSGGGNERIIPSPPRSLKMTISWKIWDFVFPNDLEDHPLPPPPPPLGTAKFTHFPEIKVWIQNRFLKRFPA